MNPSGAIEEITCKVVGTNVLSRYNNKMDQIDDIEWKNFLKVNRYSDLNPNVFIPRKYVLNQLLVSVNKQPASKKICKKY